MLKAYRINTLYLQPYSSLLLGHLYPRPLNRDHRSCEPHSSRLSPRHKFSPLPESSGDCLGLYQSPRVETSLRLPSLLVTSYHSLHRGKGQREEIELTTFDYHIMVTSYHSLHRGKGNDKKYNSQHSIITSFCL